MYCAPAVNTAKFYSLMHRLTNCFPITNPALVSEVIETTVGLIIYSFIDPLDFSENGSILPLAVIFLFDKNDISVDGLIWLFKCGLA